MRPFALLLAGLWLASEMQPALAEPPKRVVSMNLCTDQLAMLVAAPGQMLSVSYLALDSRSSSMATEAAALQVNHGQAEEIAFLRPDLVLAGRYTTRVTVQMLQRLGYQVVVFEPENSIADIRRNLRLMGQALGREARAEALIGAMDDQLAALAASLPKDRPQTALYYSSGFTSGESSFADDILEHAGLSNAAPAMGLPQGGILPLEALILAGPEVVVRGQSFQGHSRGQAMLNHPALNAMLAAPRIALETAPEWTCGTPFTVAMIEALAKASRQKDALQ